MFANRLLPLLALFILLLVLVVGLKSCHKAPETLTLAKVPVPPQPDADSPADTVRTLTAQVAELKATSASIERQNSELLRQREALVSQTRSMIQDELHKQPPTPSDPEIGALSQQLTTLQQRVNEFTVNTALPIPDSTASSHPTQDGLTLASAGGFQETLKWIEPLGADRPLASGSVLHPEGATPVPPSPTTPPPGNGLRPATLDGVVQPAGHVTPEAVRKPAYTVPRNATLIGSTAMTALIGKVPIKDSVADPFPFKVIVGRDNLASNGLDIPGVDGMVFSGHAVGDWTLGCVRGNVESVTFTFEDGTIRTLTGNANAANNAAASNPSGLNNMLGTGLSGGGGLQQVMPIGWLSDKRGIPCVSGARISNAASYLSGRVLSRAAEAAAKAFGQRNVTNSVTPLGGVFSVITGDAAQYAGLNALAGASDELSQYIKERAAQNFDVVYVDTGADVAIHIDRELPIDYDPTGRKTHYDAVLSSIDTVLD